MQILESCLLHHQNQQFQQYAHSGPSLTAIPTFFATFDSRNGSLGWNKAVYTAISVACGWAGAVLSLCKPQNSERHDQKLDDTDQWTDRWTDGPTNRHSDL